MVKHQECGNPSKATTESLSLPAQRCPLCQQNNRCGNINKTADASAPLECWCMELSIPKGLLQSLPPEQRDKACICQSCVRQFLAESALSPE